MSADLRNGVLGALQLVKRAIGHAYDVFVRLFHESLFQGGNGRARLLVHFIQHNRRISQVFLSVIFTLAPGATARAS